MTANEAYNVFIKEYKNFIAINCYEFDTMFVFNAIPSEHVGTPEANEVFDSLYAVDKKTGKCRGFNPMQIPADEYKRGKKRLIPELQKHSTTVRKE